MLPVQDWYIEIGWFCDAVPAVAIAPRMAVWWRWTGSLSEGASTVVQHRTEDTAKCLYGIDRLTEY